MPILTPRKLWNYLVRLVVVIAGLFLFATGDVFTYRSNTGLGPWDVLHQGISLHTPITFGQAIILVGVVIILAGLLLRVYPGVATLLNMLLVGIFVDLQLHLNWLPDLSHTSLLLRLFIDIIGVFITGLGTALYIIPHLGAGPRDGLMLRLHTLTKIRIGVVRALIECSVLVIGFLLGGTVGIGTLIFAFGIGPCVEFGFYLLRKIPPLVNLSASERKKDTHKSAQQSLELVD